MLTHTKMLYKYDIPLHIVKKLVDTIEKKLIGHSDVAQNFIIQYTYFELEYDTYGEMIDWNVDCTYEYWTMKSFLDIGYEKLKVIQLTISDTNTKISVYATNPKYGILHIIHKLDMRKKSTPNVIYACDLYKNFIPKNYYGKCYTK